MKRAVSFSILLVGLLTIGCAGQSANPLSESAREPGVTYFVENHGKDQRSLERLIAGVLASEGLQVKAGPRSERPQGVTYESTTWIGGAGISEPSSRRSRSRSANRGAGPSSPAA
jgi:hypothetical protein